MPQSASTNGIILNGEVHLFVEFPCADRKCAECSLLTQCEEMLHPYCDAISQEIGNFEKVGELMKVKTPK